MYCEETGKIITQNESGYQQYSITKKERRSWKVVPTTTCTLYSGSIPVTIEQGRCHPVEISTLAQQSGNAHTVQVDEYPDWEKDLFVGLKLEVSAADLIDIMIESEVYMASDGGCQGDYASYGWVMSDGETILARNTGAARGWPMQSHRAEAYGLLSVVRFLFRITRGKQFPPGSHNICWNGDNAALRNNVIQWEEDPWNHWTHG